jgi:hypothetical protein
VNLNRVAVQRFEAPTVYEVLGLNCEFVDRLLSTPRVMSTDEMNKNERNRILRTKLELARTASKSEPPGNRSHNHISGNKLSRAKNADITPRTTKSTLFQRDMILLPPSIEDKLHRSDQVHLVLCYRQYVVQLYR